MYRDLVNLLRPENLQLKSENKMVGIKETDNVLLKFYKVLGPAKLDRKAPMFIYFLYTFIQTMKNKMISYKHCITQTYKQFLRVTEHCKM